MSTIKSWPEYASIEAFVQYLIDDEREEFSHEDLLALNYRTRRPVHLIRNELVSYGLRPKVRESDRRVRGFTTSSHDRWFGPGSCDVRPGGGFNSICLGGLGYNSLTDS